MHITMSAQLREEMERFRLAFTCEACRHFAEHSATCDLLYPTEPHRADTVARLRDGEPLYFCKIFEAREGQRASGEP